MNTADRLIEKGARRLQELADKAALEGGGKERLAEELAGDAAFLRKLKPSLIAARARGQATSDETSDKPPTTPSAPPEPQLRPRPQSGDEGGPNPFVVVAAAFALGIVLAKLVDWRGHAHPRR